MKRYLITSPDERAWKFDRPVIFLGDWCCSYERRHIWSKMDAIVAKPYGVAINERKADYAIVSLLREQLFKQIYTVLNACHQVDYSSRFWRIVIGDWLIRYVDVLFNRIKTFEQCINNYEISGMSVISSDSYNLAVLDSFSTVYAFNDNYWNDILFGKIVEQYARLDFPVHVIKTESSSGFKMNEFSDGSLRGRARLYLAYVNKCAALIFSRDDDGFIINSYLPPMEEAKLLLTLGQFPLKWTLGHSQKSKLSVKINSTVRTKLGESLHSRSDNFLLSLAYRFVFELIPAVWLEGFEDLNNVVEKLAWPKNPKFVFTSNNFDFDDVFKLYAAKAVEKQRTPYYIACHGNGFFNYFENPSNSEIVADKYFTWGWSHGLSQHVPAFVLKMPNKKKINYDRDGGLLLVQMTLFNRITTWDVYAEYAEYFERQSKIVSLLKYEIIESLTIKLHGQADSRGWHECDKWKALFPLLNVVRGNVPINTLICKSRLVVHGYDSTGLPETLLMNVPTLMIFQVGFEQLNEHQKEYYELLIKAGIAHETSESLAEKINEIWNDVDRWWFQDSVQSARGLFCKQYARVEENPIQVMKQLLLSLVN